MKKYILLLIFSVSILQVFSQKKSKKSTKKNDSIIEVVNIVTSYTPTIIDAFKIKKNPRILLIENKKKQEVNYSIFSAPVASTFIPKSGVVKGIDVGQKERLYDNFFAIGYGNYNTPFLESFFHQNRKFETDYGIHLKYISSKDGIKKTPLENGYSDLSISGYYRKEERIFSWKIGVDINQQKYNWYGLPNISFDDESISSIEEMQIYKSYELESEFVFEDSYFTNIHSSLNLFNDFFGSEEIKFSLNPNFKLPLNRINRNLTDLELKTSINYLQGKFEQSYSDESNIIYRFFNIGIHPVYKIDWSRFNIKLGSKVYLNSDIENSLTDILAYPDVQITYSLIPDLVSIYSGASGDLHTNSFQGIIQNNPFVSPTLFLTQTNEQYNLFGGINGKFSSKVSFNIMASYKSDEDYLLYVRNNSKSDGVFDITSSLLGFQFGNSFNVFYDDITTLSLFAEIEIDISNKFTTGGNLQSNSYTTTLQQEAWNLPKLEATVFGKYKNDQWYATANIFFVGERKDLFYSGTFPSTTSGIQSLDSFLDVNLNGGYHFNDFFSAFIKLNNILDSNYQHYANFNVQGFQAIAGITYKFDF
tara:strand:+ start:14889 stop:16655 length:1767 start_codon:yes stop_codon:yes gene_type:complete